jgi:hypothetical protein
MVERVKKEWFALGLILIIAGLAFLGFSNTVVYADNYVPRGSLDNSVIYQTGGVPKLSVSGYFEVGERFFFTFTNGRFWGSQYDVTHRGLEPETEFAPNLTIREYKTVDFDLYTPSGDVVWTLVYLVSGTGHFAVVYQNQSADYIPLVDGNLTFINVGMEGTIARNGTYTVKAASIDPPVYFNETKIYDIAGDPPLVMNLWDIETVKTMPRLVSFASVGTVLMVSGVVFGIWASKPKRRPRWHSRKTRKDK